jgi:hypothetical protein
VTLGSTFSGVHDFFSSGTWLVIRNLLLFFVVVFWLAVAYWVYKDARRRIDDPWLVGMAVILGLVPPFLGALVYMLFRPPEYLEDVHERELEIKAMEERSNGFYSPSPGVIYPTLTYLEEAGHAASTALGSCLP